MVHRIKLPTRAGRRVAILAALLLLGACGPSIPSRPPISDDTSCHSVVETGVLPEWARAGFSDPEPTAHHVLGSSGEIAGILFGGTLSSPPSPERSNKILWVARDAFALPATLRILAQRMDGTTPIGDPVARLVDGGPGPSTIDLPEPGCWRLTLAWADRTDQLDLELEALEGGARRLQG